MFFFQASALGFTPSFLGAMQLGVAALSLAGVMAYDRLFRGVPLRAFLLGGTLLMAALETSDLALVSRLDQVRRRAEMSMLGPSKPRRVRPYGRS